MLTERERKKGGCKEEHSDGEWRGGEKEEREKGATVPLQPALTPLCCWHLAHKTTCPSLSRICHMRVSGISVKSSLFVVLHTAYLSRPDKKVFTVQFAGTHCCATHMTCLSCLHPECILRLLRCAHSVSLRLQHACNWVAHLVQVRFVTRFCLSCPV